MTEYVEEDEEEGGFCLDNDSPFSRFLQSEEGIPINGFGGQPATLSADEQRRLRTNVTGRCAHQHTQILIQMDQSMSGGDMTYSCQDCGINIIQGPVTSMKMERKAAPQIPIHTMGNPAVSYTDSGPTEFRVDVTAVNL